MFSRLYWHADAERQDPVSIPAITIAPPEPLQFLGRDVRFCVQGCGRDAVVRDSVIYVACMGTGPGFSAHTIHVALDAVCWEERRSFREFFVEPWVLWPICD